MPRSADVAGVEYIDYLNDFTHFLDRTVTNRFSFLEILWPLVCLICLPYDPPPSGSFDLLNLNNHDRSQTQLKLLFHNFRAYDWIKTLNDMSCSAPIKVWKDIPKVFFPFLQTMASFTSFHKFLAKFFSDRLERHSHLPDSPNLNHAV